MDQKCTKVTAMRQRRAKKGSTKKKKSPSHRDPGLLWIVTLSDGALSVFFDAVRFVVGLPVYFVGYVSSDASGN